MYEFLLNEIRACSEKIKSDPTSNNRPSDFTFYVLVLLSSFATHGVVADAHFPVCCLFEYNKQRFISEKEIV